MVDATWDPSDPGTLAAPLSMPDGTVVAVTGDPFAPEVPDRVLDLAYATMGLCRGVTFECATRHADRAAAQAGDRGLAVGAILMDHARGDASREFQVIRIVHDVTFGNLANVRINALA